jgi:hypothetical protein
MHVSKAAFALILLVDWTPRSTTPTGEEVVRSAIRAAGGEETLNHFATGQVIGKGTLLAQGGDVPFTFELDYELPDRFRMVIHRTVKGHSQELIQVVNHGEARQFVNGKKTRLSDAASKEILTAASVNECGLLTPLLNGQRYSVKRDKSSLVGVNGLIVQGHGLPEVRFAFDASSGHLVRVAYKSIDTDTSKEAELVTSFEDFRTFSGLTRSMKSSVSLDGRKVLDLQIEKFNALDKVDPGVFAIK